MSRPHSRVARPIHLGIASLALSAFGAAPVAAQCCGQAPVATPTVALSPVVAAPVTPVIYQSTVTQRDGWYPGKYLGEFTRSIFGGPTTTVTTANYAPTYAAAPAYSAAPAGYVTAYRPTYPVSYGPVVPTQSYAMYSPYSEVQTVARPVVLSPVVTAATMVDSCSACTACSAGGVSQATYDAPVVGTSGCSSCAASPVGGSAPIFSEPQPRLAPSENPPADRSMLKPADPMGPPAPGPAEEDSASPAEEDSSGAFFQAPPLFDPKDRLTEARRAPVWAAVYHQPATAAPAAPAQRPRHQVGATGWSATGAH